MLRGITSIHNADFDCLNCLHLYRTENKLKQHENVCKNHNYCHVEMPNENNKILKYNPGEKCMRDPFITYADLECLLEKISTCHNNPKKSSTAKLNKHTPSGYSLSTCRSFDATKNKLDYCRGRDCMKKLCETLKEHVEKIIICKKKEMIPLTDEENESYLKQEVSHTYKKIIITDGGYGMVFIVIILENIEELHIKIEILAIKY